MTECNHRVIRLQRQGVGHTLRAWFNPCQHGHDWYVELGDYQRKHYLVSLHYPDCHECFGPVSPAPVEPEEDQLTNASWDAYVKEKHAWQMAIRSGQVAWSSWGKSKPICAGAAQQLVLPVIAEMTGVSGWSFAPEVEAYMLYSAGDLTGYPYLADDVYLACAVYDRESDTVRHLPSDTVLISIGEHVTIENKRYLKECARAIAEYGKAHIQREPEERRKAWLAWLVSEYIKDNCAGETPVMLKEMNR